MTKHIQESLGLPIMNDVFNHSEQIFDKQELIDSEIMVNDDEQISHESAMTDFADTAQAKAEDLIELGYSVDPKAAGSILGAAAKFMALALEAKKSIRDTQLQMTKIQIEAMKIAKMPAIANNTPATDMSAPGAKIDRNELIKKLTNRAMSSDE
jgi:galactokinase/mevalonate kinase-like predicted kinase